MSALEDVGESSIDALPDALTSLEIRGINPDDLAREQIRLLQSVAIRLGHLEGGLSRLEREIARGNDIEASWLNLVGRVFDSGVKVLKSPTVAYPLYILFIIVIARVAGLNPTALIPHQPAIEIAVESPEP